MDINVKKVDGLTDDQQKRYEDIVEKSPKLKAIKDGDNRAVVDCPYCGKKHYHTWSSGWRVPHCDGPCDEGDYYIICE